MIVQQNKVTAYLHVKTIWVRWWVNAVRVDWGQQSFVLQFAACFGNLSGAFVGQPVWWSLKVVVWINAAAFNASHELIPHQSGAIALFRAWFVVSDRQLQEILSLILRLWAVNTVKTWIVLCAANLQHPCRWQQSRRRQSQELAEWWYTLHT